ncbi:M20/M25/M40 family metallo-hydrolase [Planctomicrobium sp. SH661]|uniref:M20/M25/M40 family metallo-hydrolase n=1 Tax=Planctomicrobium sp. SH661 TaxID=3448124 RepID=UPI003F5C7039
MSNPPDVTSLVDESAIDLVLRMLAIPGKSGQESAIARFIVDELKSLGIADSQIQFDNAHKKSPFGGEVGNLIVKLPGTLRKPRKLLMAHIDTVPLCVGCEPVRDGNLIRSKNPKTALGGDDRAGAATLLNTLRLIQTQKLPHPPLTFFWAVQEEVGLVGARHVAINKLGNPKLCFNWDGGPAQLATIGATGDDHIAIEITGLASHAGAHPEDGVSAIAIAALAISSLVADGWHGKVVKGKKTGTSNIGVISGGDATNVVTDRVVLKGEARSHDPAFRAKIVEAYRKAFTQAAKSIKNAAGQTGSVKFEATHKYESFRIDPKSEIVQAASNAIRQVGLTPETRISNGGLDANWMFTHGLPTVTLGCGQSGIHTVNEVLHLDTYLNACRIALLLATT